MLVCSRYNHSPSTFAAYSKHIRYTMITTAAASTYKRKRGLKKKKNKKKRQYLLSSNAKVKSRILDLGYVRSSDPMSTSASLAIKLPTMPVQVPSGFLVPHCLLGSRPHRYLRGGRRCLRVRVLRSWGYQGGGYGTLG